MIEMAVYFITLLRKNTVVNFPTTIGKFGHDRKFMKTLAKDDRTVSSES